MISGRGPLVVTVGAAAGVALASGAGVPARDTTALLAMSLGSAGVVSMVGWLLVRRAATAGAVRSAATVVALIPVASLAVGAIAAAKAMFVSSHDLAALGVILVGAGTAGVLGALSLAGQLTAARRAADAARERERLAERSRRELVAWVSHDLRTPLAGLRAMTEAIDDGVVDDRDTIRRYHRQMNDEVMRLSRLVDDLFEVSRIEANALNLRLERASLADLVLDAVASVEPLAHAQQVSIDAAAGSPHVAVDVSARELTRVLHNLLDNAIRHTPPGGTVRVEVRALPTTTVIEVSDECGGIPEDDLDRVFELAYRGDPARSPGGGGGLGLAIARGLIDAHSGTIAVENADDGCRFRISLPVPALS